ncbi:MAG: hypothetical protein AAFR83_15270, partial [Cyanobacteria bacterium J06629_18]
LLALLFGCSDNELLFLELGKAGDENIKHGRVTSKAEITVNLLLANKQVTLGDTTIKSCQFL